MSDVKETTKEIIPVEEYNEMLRTAGLEELTTITTAFQGDVSFDNIEYRKDVFMGDICTIQNRDWGLHTNSRLVEVIESVDESGKYTISPSFGA